MNSSKDPSGSDNHQLVNEQRRRLAKGGLAAPIVIGTLLSRPVLGAAPHNCTISGQMSGNVSTHGAPVDCKTLGVSPGYWKNHPLDWTPHLPTAAFNTVFADAYSWKTQNPNAIVLAKPGTSGFSPNPTFMQVLNSTVGMRPNFNFPALGRAAVASWLNAYHKVNYPLTQAEVIAMFNAVYLGGTYQVNPTTSWNATQVLAYFESLYS